ncbi:MAG: hypothetical protein BWY74_04377 [Firmicutes bacterium ADurb.Bin419]|nr:MAG: hypothetical protein BWY74_04377 [Firmicutes bacterium ADurb.Bin419]
MIPKQTAAVAAAIVVMPCQNHGIITSTKAGECKGDTIYTKKNSTRSYCYVDGCNAYIYTNAQFAR